jgi:hypothetical protein
MQSKTIMRDNSATITVDSLLPTTPYGAYTTVPSIDSELQLESLDLNSYESFNVSPLTPAISPGVESVDGPMVPRFLEKRSGGDAIPFDELDTHVKLPDFPTAVEPSFPIPETSTDDVDTNEESAASAYEDDDTITSHESSHVSAVGTDDSSSMEEQAGYLSQFVDAAVFGDITLFTSLVNEIVDSAKHAAKLVVTEKGDPIDDQGPIKIGDNYYTHQEAIRKWKKARDKLKDSKYRKNDEKLQRKLEKAAMDAAQLMAATKTWDLAARRSGHHMEKKENKRAVKALAKLGEWNKEELAKLSSTSAWEKEELEKIRSWEVEKAKNGMDTKDGAFSIHQLVNRFTLFGFSLDEVEVNPAGEHPDRQTNRTTPVKTRFDFLEEPSNDADDLSKCPHGRVDENLMEEENLREQRFQYLTKSMEEEEEDPFDCIEVGDSINAEPLEAIDCETAPTNEEELDDSSHGEVEQELDVFPIQESVTREKMNIFSNEEPLTNDSDSEEYDLEVQESLEDNSAPRASPLSMHSRSVASPSPATHLSYTSLASSTGMTNASTAGMTNASSITELAGCSAKNKGEMEPSISTYQSDDPSTTSSLEDLGLVEADTHNQPDKTFNYDVVNDEIRSVGSKASNDTTSSSTKDNSSTASEESAEAHGVEVESFHSVDHSGILSGASTNDQSGILSGESTYTGTTTSETAYSSSQSRALTNIPPERKLDFDSEPLTILEEAACFLLEACQGEMSECPSVPSKYTLDSFIGSEYGTEIIFNTPKTTVNRPNTPIHEPERIVTERKPRMSSNGSRGLVTPSPTKKPSKSSSPMAKRMNPLNLLPSLSHQRRIQSLR